jgi:hypothetical protein
VCNHVRMRDCASGTPDEVVPELGVRICADLNRDLRRSAEISSSSLPSHLVELRFFSSLLTAVTSERDDARATLRTWQHGVEYGAASVLCVALLLALVRIARRYSRSRWRLHQRELLARVPAASEGQPAAAEEHVERLSGWGQQAGQHEQQQERASLMDGAATTSDSRSAG